MPVSIKNSLYMKLITAGCIFLCACSSSEEIALDADLADLEMTLTEVTTTTTQTTIRTTFTTQATSSQTETSATTTTAPQTQATTKETVTTSDYKQFAERRELLKNTDVWSAEFREKPIAEKLEFLQIIFPDGLYWNLNDSSSINSNNGKEMMISTKKCNHSASGRHSCNRYFSVLSKYFSFGDFNIQCLGFANMFSDILYGKDAATSEFNDYEELEVGDTVRLLHYNHSVIVIGKNDEYITVAECNDDYQRCEISWGRQINRYALREGSARFFKRNHVEAES